MYLVIVKLTSCTFQWTRGNLKKRQFVLTFLFSHSQFLKLILTQSKTVMHWSKFVRCCVVSQTFQKSRRQSGFLCLMNNIKVSRRGQKWVNSVVCCTFPLQNFPHSFDCGLTANYILPFNRLKPLVTFHLVNDYFPLRSVTSQRCLLPSGGHFLSPMQ